MFLSGMLTRGRTRVKANLVSPATRGVRWLAAAAWMGGIFYLSHQSAPGGRSAGTFESVVAHLALYAGLALLLFWALGATNGRPQAPLWARMAVAFALSVLYGVSDEIHQSFVPARTASEADIALDALGSAAALSLALLFGFLRRPGQLPRLP
jgi:VanZ family protein